MTLIYYYCMQNCIALRPGQFNPKIECYLAYTSTFHPIPPTAPQKSCNVQKLNDNLSGM